MANTAYLKYDADSMVTFLRNYITASGQFTDQVYAGSNAAIIIETLSALYEILIYQMNFQAAEASFNTCNIYENMVKILSSIGYKPRLSISPTITAQFTGRIYTNVLNNLSFNTTDSMNVVTSRILNKMNELLTAKILTRDFVVSDANNEFNYSPTESALLYPNVIYDNDKSIYYYANNDITGATNGILKYLNSRWGTELTLNDMIGDNSTFAIVDDGDFVNVELRSSSLDDENYSILTNGVWKSAYITNASAGSIYEEYIVNINAESELPANGTLYAIVYNNELTSDNILTGATVWKGVRNIQEYTANDRVFDYGVTSNKLVSVRFGNGIYGRQIDPNCTIVLYYLQGAGEAAQLSKNKFAANTLSTSNTIDNSAILSYITDETIIDSLDKIFLERTKPITTNESNIITILTNYDTNAIDPKMEVYATVLNNATDFVPLEMVEYLRAIAPLYNRTNNRIITRNDLYTYMLNEFGNIVYDVHVMNNWDYMSQFYAWAYNYGKLSKDMRLRGYKFADACDFNNMYVWLKGFTNNPINDYTKQIMDRNILTRKPLTAEPVFLDAINVKFYPYVGNINDDIAWLKRCMDLYKFASKSSEDFAQIQYKKLQSLFEYDSSGNPILGKPNSKIIEYIFSNDCKEMKVQLDVFRDSNSTENVASIINNVIGTVNSFFDIDKHKLGEQLQLSNLSNEIYDINGVIKVATTKYRNIGIYNSLPANTAYDYNGNTLQLNVAIAYPINIVDPSETDGAQIIYFMPTLNGEEIDLPATLYCQNLSTGETKKLTESGRYKFNIYSDWQKTFTASEQIFNSYKFYYVITRESDIDGEETSYETNSITITLHNPYIIQSTTNIRYDYFVASNSANTDIGTSSVYWEQHESINSVSFAKWTDTLLNGADFEYVGASNYKINNFAFPILHKTITSETATLKEDDIKETIGIEY